VLLQVLQQLLPAQPLRLLPGRAAPLPALQPQRAGDDRHALCQCSALLLLQQLLPAQPRRLLGVLSAAATRRRSLCSSRKT
jgi:hypothetical protein